MLKQRDTVMSFTGTYGFIDFKNPLHLIRSYAQIHKKCCRHERDLERLSPNVAASFLRTWASMSEELALRNLYSQKIATDIGISCASSCLLFQRCFSSFAGVG